MTDGRDKPPFGFEPDKPGTNARTEAEADIEALRQRGGLFVEAVARTRMPMAVTDARLPGNPIVFANDAFLRLSGYSMAETMGQQPHFLNGPDTDPDHAASFREALRRGEDIVVDTCQYRKDGSRFFAAVFVSPVADEHGEVIQHFLSYLDITRRAEAEERARGHAAQLEAEIIERTRTLRESEERLREFGEASQDVLWIRDAGTWQWTYLTAAFEAIYGLSRAEAKSGDDYRRWLDLILPEDRAQVEEKIAEVRGGARVAFEFRIRRPSDGEIRWLRNTDFPIRDASGRVALIGGVGTDITERKRAEEHQRMLVGELQHRVRNTLGLVRSIVRRTAHNSATVEEMSGHLEGRLDAFARVQSMVTRRPDAGVDLAAMIEDELVAHAAREGDAVQLTGPDVALATRPAETLSLALHELTTNAVKYGALSMAEGRLTVRWTLAEGRFELIWEEMGVPGLPAEPEREGFGLELLRRGIPYELSAETTVAFLPDGLRFTLAMPAEGNIRVL